MNVVAEGISDEAFAAALRTRMDAALVPVLAIFKEAQSRGMNIGWDSIQCDAFGRWQATGIKVTKVIL